MSTVQTTNIKHAASASNNITLDASGNVGVGTASPALNSVTLSRASGFVEYRVQSGANNAYLGLDASSAYLGTLGAQPVQFQTTGSERMRITAAGNVGIGTSAPASRLEVASSGSVTPLYARGANGGLYVDFAGTGGNYYDANVHYFRNGPTSTEIMRIDGFSGNVGIGTASPAYPLSINRAGATDSYAQWTNGAGGNFIVGVASTGTALLYNGANTPMSFVTNNITRANITSGGDFQFNSGYGSVATAYGCRAWVNFNGTGTVAIRASGNVSSITDFNTGDYGINLATAMPDANYAVVGSYQFDGTLPAAVNTFDQSMQIYPQLTNQIYVYTGFVNSGSSNRVDVLKCCIAVFR